MFLTLASQYCFRNNFCRSRAGGIALARKRGLVVLVAVRCVVFIVEIVAMQFLFSVREAR